MWGMKKLFKLAGLVGVAAAAIPFGAAALNVAVQKTFPYAPDEGDDPPLYYTKVCEPGLTDEKDASYVILGVPQQVAARVYPAVDPNYRGRLVIPAYLDGLPVRKIGEAAFIACQSLTDVTIPVRIRPIPRAASSRR